MDAPKCRLCGERHYGLCASAKNSRGGGGSRPAIDKKGSVLEALGQSTRDAKAHRDRNGERPPSRPRGESRIGTAGVAPGPREAKRKQGRPRVEDRAKTLVATKPWLLLGMSRSTWYLRQRNGKKAKR